jgi:hypothetical protein
MWATSGQPQVKWPRDKVPQVFRTKEGTSVSVVINGHIIQYERITKHIKSLMKHVSQEGGL